MRGGRRERGEGGRGRGAAPCFRVTRRVAGAGLGRQLPPASITAESVRLAARQAGTPGPRGRRTRRPAAPARAPLPRPPGNPPPRCSAVCTLIRAGWLFSAHSLGSRWQNNAFPGRALGQGSRREPDGGGGRLGQPRRLAPPPDPGHPEDGEDPVALPQAQWQSRRSVPDSLSLGKGGEMLVPS